VAQHNLAPDTPARRPRLRIAFVTDRFGARFGGAESYGVALMQELAQHHQVTVVASCYDPDCPVRLPWVKVAVPRGLPSWLRVLCFALRARRLTRTGFDLVHSHVNGWCGDVEVAHVTPVRWRWRVAATARGKRLLSYLSLRVQTYLALEAARFRPRAAHCVVAVSDLIAGQLQAAYGQRDVPVIMPGVAPAAAAAAQWRTSIRAQLGVGAGATVCLMVARDPLRKGFDTAVQALRHLPADTLLVLVGGGAVARAWLQRSPYAEVQARVRLLGELADVRPYYAAADVCLHPTRNDSFGMAPLEAMAYGVPVVLSPMPWCGFAQYVQHGVHALVLEQPEDAQALAGFVMQLRDQPALRQGLSAAGRVLAGQYGWHQVAQQYQHVYAQILRARANT